MRHKNLIAMTCEMFTARLLLRRLTVAHDAQLHPHYHHHHDEQHRITRRSLNPRTIRVMSSSSSWSCKKCTFLNSPSQKSQCQVCLTPISSSSSSSSPDDTKWACKTRTFLNSYKNSVCEICGTRAPTASLMGLDDLTDTGRDGDQDSSVGSIFFPLRRCKRKASDAAVVEVDNGCGDGSESLGFRADKDLRKETETTGGACDSGASLSCLKILSYNVWFREDLELHSRMKAIGDLIQLHSPHLICFQEVTPDIYDIFRNSSWWSGYSCSVSMELAHSRPYFCMQLSKLPVESFSRKSFRNSIMGRELSIAEVEVPGHKPVFLATSHLESPCPAPPTWNQMFSPERVEQAREALKILGTKPNVIFGGDMNWDDKLDGKFPLLDKWVDAWEVLKPSDTGFTYDTKSNPMLSGNRTLQKRLDRFLCRLDDYKIGGVEMIGKEAIPGLSYVKEKKVRNEMKKLELPVLPSDHFGLLLTISPK